MSLLPYHKGNKTKFTNLLFQLIHLTAFEAGADNKIIMETTRINYETPHVEVMLLELEQAVLQSSFEPTDGNL